MKSVAIAVGATALASAATPWHQLQASNYSFDSYEREFRRSYTPEERETRREIVEAKLKIIFAHNADNSQTWKRGVNSFTDRTPEELSTYRGLDKHMLRAQSSSRPNRLHVTANKQLPASVDWRDENIITPVKNQGHCGSCWAFASTETIESHWAMKTGVLEELSEQFILDCTPNPHKCGGTGGCMGGTGELAFGRLQEIGGIPSEWTYPYTSGNAGEAGTCHGIPLPPPAPHDGSVSAAANVTGFKTTEENSYSSMMDAIANAGPMAVSVDASAWHDYESGIFSGGNMTNPDLDHLTQLVGYGSDNTGSYWLVRNSWTALWGEKGYIRLARYGDGKEPCGTDVTPLDGNGCEGGPSTVKVCGQSGVLYDGVYPTV